MTVCRVCRGKVEKLFNYKLLGHHVNLFECLRCAYVSTEEPYWLVQAYQSAINSNDTGIMLRNAQNVSVVLATLAMLGLTKERVVDCAGGYGILVRMLRDVGVDAYWSDPYSENLLARGFDHSGEKAALVTAFEAFEHFVNPPQELEELFSIAPNLLMSTELIPTPAPKIGDWWYYIPETGQHIGFFRIPTLEYLAKKFNKFLISDGRSYHLFCDHPTFLLQWRIFRILAKKIPSLFTRGLSPLTQTDFEFNSHGRVT